MDKMAGLIVAMKALSGLPSCFFSVIFGLAIFFRIPEHGAMELEPVAKSALWVILWTVCCVSLPFSFTAIVSKLCDLSKSWHKSWVDARRRKDLFQSVENLSTGAKDLLHHPFMIESGIEFTDRKSCNSRDWRYLDELRGAGIIRIVGEFSLSSGHNIKWEFERDAWNLLRRDGLDLLFKGDNKPTSDRNIGF